MPDIMPEYRRQPVEVSISGAFDPGTTPMRRYEMVASVTYSLWLHLKHQYAVPTYPGTVPAS
jgi:hypothetical protein